MEDLVSHEQLTAIFQEVMHTRTLSDMEEAIVQDTLISADSRAAMSVAAALGRLATELKNAAHKVEQLA